MGKVSDHRLKDVLPEFQRFLLGKSSRLKIRSILCVSSMPIS